MIHLNDIILVSFRSGRYTFYWNFLKKNEVYEYYYTESVAL